MESEVRVAFCFSPAIPQQKSHWGIQLGSEDCWGKWEDQWGSSLAHQNARKFYPTATLESFSSKKKQKQRSFLSRGLVSPDSTSVSEGEKKLLSGEMRKNQRASLVQENPCFFEKIGRRTEIGFTSGVECADTKSTFVLV